MQKKIDVQYNPTKIAREFNQSFNKARRMVKSEIAKDSAPLTPMRNGTLIKSVTVSVRKDDAYLVWNSPYARFLYKGEGMVGELSGKAWAKKYERKVTNGKKLEYFKGANTQAGPEWFAKAKKKSVNKWLKIYAKGAER